jgi:hypothetical protein
MTVSASDLHFRLKLAENRWNYFKQKSDQNGGMYRATRFGGAGTFPIPTSLARLRIVLRNDSRIFS